MLDYQKSFQVYTDASEMGLGAQYWHKNKRMAKSPLLHMQVGHCQNQRSDTMHISQSFCPSNGRSLIDSMSTLYGGNFEVYTDNNPLTYVLMTAELDTTGQRWVAALAMYNFKIYYQSGKLNANADALSQIPWETSEIVDSKVLEPYVVKAIMMKSDQISWPLEESVIAKAAHFLSHQTMHHRCHGESGSRNKEQMKIFRK